ncbi:inositol-3-phosphate synthase [Caerostris extrusa]|uniref:Inositol-3-phosphate synthase n=1 Tax=Caerostris extrusa TaxID=172846 RepID=A0AAV4PVU9_CAEEX|nr:inositol-3-phosphate synthase [Caerostris extrusa]
MSDTIEVQSPNTRYTDKYIEADYKYDTNHRKKEKGILKVIPRTTRVQFRTSKHVPKLGVMLVGWGRKQWLHCNRGCFGQ